ncbi:MAG: von Willebrand factor, type [Acidobacteriaceae bacterium]|nr:von Willebrand factor, type [Acidobacteriaceae bacterium]
MLSCFRFCPPLCVLGISLLATAQSPAPASAPEYRFLAPLATISSKVNEVNLAFTVTDHHGHFISNLRPDDFRLLDNQLTPRRLTFFQQRSDLPLHVAVLIDASASVKYRFKVEQNSALAFVRKILRPGKDKALVIAFNDQVTTIQDLTDRATSVSKAIARVNPEGNTALYDAVIYAAEKLRRIPEDGITRRAIVVVSDGVDTVNRSSLLQAQAAVARAEVMIFSLTTNTSQFEPNAKGDEVLRQLAISTGGSILPAHDEPRLSSSLRNVEKALRNQYVVAYSPPEFHADGAYHKVEVLPVKKGLRANCRKGYYASASVEAMKTQP